MQLNQTYETKCYGPAKYLGTCTSRYAQHGVLYKFVPLVRGKIKYIEHGDLKEFLLGDPQ